MSDKQTVSAPVPAPAEPKPVMFRLGDKVLSQADYDAEFAKLAAAARAPAPAKKE